MQSNVCVTFDLLDFVSCDTRVDYAHGHQSLSIFEHKRVRDTKRANIGRLIVPTRFSIFITKRERACLLRKLSELGARFSENVVRTTSFNRSSIKNVLTRGLR